MSSTNQKNLLQLLYLRSIAIFGQVITIFFVNYFLEISLPLFSMMMVILILVAVSFVGFYNCSKKTKITDARLFAELTFDVLAFAAQIYFSGGIFNPFISLFLLQVIIAAMLLKNIYAALIAILTMLCYLWLGGNYQELHELHHHGQNLFSLHLIGMFISYAIASILLVIFIGKIMRNLQEKNQQVIAQEQLARMGLLASGAAHELGTPLSTISVILSDLKLQNIDKKEIEIIESQLARCKKIISNIANFSGVKRFEEARSIKAREGFEKLLQEWHELKNPTEFSYKFYGENIEIIFDEILAQSLFDILNNAFEASPAWVEMKVEIDKKYLKIIVNDRGVGFKKEVLKNLGNKNLSTKNSSGLGLFLAINALARINGKLEAKNLETGAQVKITIKL